MNNNELRIGNYVTDSKTGKVVTVDGLQFTGRIVTHDESYDDWKRGIEPVGILLTPEILEKAGFNDSGEAVGSNWYYRLINIPSNHMNPTYELNLFTTEEENKYGINLEDQYFGYCTSLHQLQNLYFALTGEELPIEL